MIRARPATNRSSLPLLLVAALPFVAVLSVRLLQYAEIPLTNHARQAHASETWNATSIANYFDQGGCTPTEYVCKDSDFRVAYCEIDRGKAIGLVIGLSVEKIITGFMADTTYWQRRCP